MNRVRAAGIAWLVGAAVGMVSAMVVPPDDEPPPRTVVAPRHVTAVEVAAEYVRIVGSAIMYDDAARGEALADVLAEPTGEQARLLDRGFRTAALTLGVGPDGTSGSGELVSRMVPVGVQLLEYERDQATVAVWCVGLLGMTGADSTLPVQQSWSTETVQLRQTSSGWRVTGAANSDGPVPVMAPHEPATSELMGRTMLDFIEVADAG